MLCERKGGVGRGCRMREKDLWKKVKNKRGIERGNERREGMGEGCSKERKMKEESKGG